MGLLSDKMFLVFWCLPAWTAQASVSRSIATQPGVWLFWAACIIEDFSVMLSRLQHLQLLASLALYIGNERLEAAISQLYCALNWLKPSLVCSNTRHGHMRRRRRAALNLSGMQYALDLSGSSELYMLVAQEHRFEHTWPKSHSKCRNEGLPSMWFASAIFPGLPT